MAIAVDGSTPIRWTKVLTIADTTDSASFTAPTDALLVACISCDGATDANWGTLFVMTDSGGLTWTERVRRSWSETTAGGAAIISTARTTSSVARTATFNRGGGGASNFQGSIKLYVLTGVDVNGTPVDTVTANNEGGSATNNLTTTSITPGATGLIIGADCDWNASGVFEAPGDGSTQDTATYTGISVCSAYKACTSGVGVTLNFNAAGSATVQHKWCQIIVRAAAGGPAFLAAPNKARFGAVHRSSNW